MSENVPPSKNAEILAPQGVEHVWSPPHADGGTAKMYPLYPQNVPPFVPLELRVEALSFGTHYFAVLRREGQPDETIDGPDGKPLRFGSASDAIRAGKAKLVPEAKALQTEAKTFRSDRSRDLDEERRHVFSRFGGGR